MFHVNIPLLRLLTEGITDKPRTEFRKRNARRTRGIGKQRCSRHAGNGIRLQRPARTVFFQNEIRARNPFARQRAVGTNRKLLHHPRRFIRQRRGTQVLRTTGSIFRLEIVEIAFRNDFDYSNASTSVVAN